MKERDDLLPDGRLVSGARNAVKANQHEHRVVLHWNEHEQRWVVARPRLRARPLAKEIAPEWAEFCDRTGLNPASKHWLGLCAVARSWPIEILPESAVRRGQQGERPLYPQVVLGDPGEVVVTFEGSIDGDVIEVAGFGVVWRGHHPESMYCDEGRLLVRLDGNSDRTVAIAAAIRSIRARRRKRYRRCKACAEMTPPEWWYGKGYCQSCASRELGVVY